MTKRELVILVAACAGWLLFGGAVAYHVVGQQDIGARIRKDCESIARELGYLPLPRINFFGEDGTPEMKAEGARRPQAEQAAKAYIDGCIHTRAKIR